MRFRLHAVRTKTSSTASRSSTPPTPRPNCSTCQRRCKRLKTTATTCRTAWQNTTKSKLTQPPTRTCPWTPPSAARITATASPATGRTTQPGPTPLRAPPDTDSPTSGTTTASMRGRTSARSRNAYIHPPTCPMWGFLPKATAGSWSGVPAPREILDASRVRASFHSISKLRGGIRSANARHGEWAETGREKRRPALLKNED
eukprot:4237183-Pleurochrysis_carterae.AAC.2